MQHNNERLFLPLVLRDVHFVLLRLSRNMIVKGTPIDSMYLLFTCTLFLKVRDKWNAMDADEKEVWSSLVQQEEIPHQV